MWRVEIKLDGKSVLAHRIAWKIMTGDDPPDLVDHENRQDTDNRWDNLRLATHSQNMQNRSVVNNKTTGLKGVFFIETSKRFRAYISVNKKRIHLGTYATKEEAHAAYCAAAKAHFGEFWCAG